jgi:hypothetical protein
VPARLTVCGLFAALSLIVNVPAPAPRTVGEKVTPMAHVPPAATLAPQVLVATEKAPAAATLVKFSGTLPRFVTVTVDTALVLPTAVLGRFRVLVETVTGTMPVPVKLAVWGLLAALSVMVSVPVSAPSAVGENAMDILQDAPAATEPAPTGHVPPAYANGPLTAIVLIFRGVVCRLVIVSVCVALRVPSG